MLADFHVVSIGITAVIAPAAEHRAVQTVDTVSGKPDPGCIVSALFYIAANDHGFPKGSRFVRVAVVHLDVMHGTVCKKLLRLLPGVGIDCQVPGKAGRHIVAVFAFLPFLGEVFFRIRVDSHMACFPCGGFPLAPGSGNLTGRDFIQSSRHVFAAVSFGCVRAVAFHAFNPLSPKMNGYLILPGTLHGRIIGLAVPDQ